MMPTLESLLADAARLPTAQRIQLMEALWDTLPADALPPLSDEWNEEIQRRSDEFDAGRVETIPWEQIKAEAIRRAGQSDATR